MTVDPDRTDPHTVAHPELRHPETSNVGARALLTSRWTHRDNYAGTAEQLVAAGLVRHDQFPGQPGRNKGMATYFVLDGVPVPFGRSGFEPTFQVKRLNSTRFEVAVDVSYAESQRRCRMKKEGKDLSDAPAFNSEDPPNWTPEGLTFRCKREGDYVFVATIDGLRTSGLMGQKQFQELQALPTKMVRFWLPRFGYCGVAHRTANTYFVALWEPTEIRNAEYSVSEAATHTWHRGTKEQLQARGLAVGFAFPGEPGCKRRRHSAEYEDTDKTLTITLLNPNDWAGNVQRFVVKVPRSAAELEAQREAVIAADIRRRRIDWLKSMPQTPDDLRASVSALFWDYVNLVRTAMMRTQGYRFDPEAVDAFTDAAREAFQAIKDGEVTGESPQLELQRMLGAGAKADKPLQRFLTLVCPGSSH